MVKVVLEKKDKKAAETVWDLTIDEYQEIRASIESSAEDDFRDLCRRKSNEKMRAKQSEIDKALEKGIELVDTCQVTGEFVEEALDEESQRCIDCGRMAKCAERLGIAQF